ncbi:MAG TPA: conjugal transfer protein TraF [Vicinamibacterales bacterium]|nr:conjugal transfer protein TraF [Vicinamibacterales bacterium]
MTKISRVLASFVAAISLPSLAAAQAFPAVGTRAAGMGGAFVGVADDASAIYWNPGALAAGSYFSLVVDGGAGKVAPDLSPRGGEHSSFFLGLAMPALGLGYYRLHATTVLGPPILVPVDAELSSRNLSAVAELRLDTLITHHAGITLVQSVVPGVSVGTTLKLVRGIAASSNLPSASVEEALDSEAAELLGRATNKIDLDLGILAAGGPLRVGLTLRNLREPTFEAAGSGGDLRLERQARAGLSYAIGGDWVAAADFDLLRTRDAFGERRDVALGTEGRLGPRAVVRGGVSINTVEEPELDGAARRAYSLGASYAVKASVYVDGHFATGNDRAGHQWGVAARFVY